MNELEEILEARGPMQLEPFFARESKTWPLEFMLNNALHYNLSHSNQSSVMDLDAMIAVAFNPPTSIFMGISAIELSRAADRIDAGERPNMPLEPPPEGPSPLDEMAHKTTGGLLADLPDEYKRGVRALFENVTGVSSAVSAASGAFAQLAEAFTAIEDHGLDVQARITAIICGFWAVVDEHHSGAMS